jgi:hypothetical protein
MRSIIFLVGLLSLLVPSKAVLLAYDPLYRYIFVKDYMIIVHRPNYANDISNSYGYCGSHRLIYGNLKSPYQADVRGLVRTIADTINTSNIQQVEKYISRPTPELDLFGSYSTCTHVNLNGRCYKYTWWSQVHVTTDTCKIGRRGMFYFAMPKALWSQHKRNFPKTTRGKLGAIARGVPYSKNSKFVYAVKVIQSSKCRYCRTPPILFLRRAMDETAQRSSLRRDPSAAVEPEPNDIPLFMIGSYVIHKQSGACMTCPRRAVKLVKLIGSTDCHPRLFTIGEVNMSPDARRLYGSLARAMVLCRW